MEEKKDAFLASKTNNKVTEIRPLRKISSPGVAKLNQTDGQKHKFNVI